MDLPNLTIIRLLSDRYRSHGVTARAIGVILETYPDAHEVEFSREDGTTIAWLAVARDEVEALGRH